MNHLTLLALFAAVPSALAEYDWNCYAYSDGGCANQIGNPGGSTSGLVSGCQAYSGKSVQCMQFDDGDCSMTFYSDDACANQAAVWHADEEGRCLEGTYGSFQIDCRPL